MPSRASGNAPPQRGAVSFPVGYDVETGCYLCHRCEIALVFAHLLAEHLREEHPDAPQYLLDALEAA